MPMDRDRYPSNWSEIATAIKEKARWRCQHCGRQCYRPGEKPKDLTRSEWTTLTLSVHHSNRDPADNRAENLIPLCTPCHLASHAGRRGNITPGQLSFDLEF
jgi:predicted HNH restriction endonuclease